MVTTLYRDPLQYVKPYEKAVLFPKCKITHLNFPIFVSNMSVAVIFSFLSFMRAGHSSSICSCVSVLLPHALQVGSVFL